MTEPLELLSALEPSAGDRVLVLGDDGGGPLRSLEALGAHGVHVGRGAAVTARPDRLPFLDGTFDGALVVGGESEVVEGALRDVVRVLRPGGRFVFRLRTACDPGLARTFARLGVDATPRNGLWVGGREASVAPEIWRSLATGAGTIRWNDEMFRFKQTPYDPWTVAGRIFLKRVRWIASLVPDRPGLRVLEIGCEAGGLLRHLPERPTVVGLDVSAEALRAASKNLAGRTTTFVLGDATGDLPFPDESFDFVISSEMLEHCRSPQRAIANMHRLVRPGGRVIISVPNERHYLQWKRWLRSLPLLRLALRGIEEDAAAWHLDHDFDRAKLRALTRDFFEVRREKLLLGTTLIFVLGKHRTI